jgi:hypothetical protein
MLVHRSSICRRPALVVLRFCSIFRHVSMPTVFEFQTALVVLRYRLITSTEQLGKTGNPCHL